MKSGLFNNDETPFNLSGELIDNSTTEEGEARVRALAEAEARKAQGTFVIHCPDCGLETSFMEDGLHYCPDCKKDIAVATLPFPSILESAEQERRQERGL